VTTVEKEELIELKISAFYYFISFKWCFLPVIAQMGFVDLLLIAIKS